MGIRLSIGIEYPFIIYSVYPHLARRVYYFVAAHINTYMYYLSAVVLEEAKVVW